MNSKPAFLFCHIDARDGHGGNILLMQRESSDYQVSILELAGQFDSDAEILALEQLWKLKLQPSLCAN